MRKTTTDFPLVPIALGAIFAFLTDKKESTEAKAWAGQQLTTATTPLKKYFTELMEEFNSTLDLLKHEATNCQPGKNQDINKGFPIYRENPAERHDYKGYYGT